MNGNDVVVGKDGKPLPLGPVTPLLAKALKTKK